MIGFVIGALCLFGLIKVLRGGRSCGRHSHARRRHRRRGPGLYWLFDRLDTSPGQEKAIRAALRDLADEAGGLRQQMHEAKSAARSALAEPVFDEAPLDALFEAHDGALARLRVSFKEALRTVHETLDDEQRTELGRLLRRFGPMRAFEFGTHGDHHVTRGPYR